MARSHSQDTRGVLADWEDELNARDTTPASNLATASDEYRVTAALCILWAFIVLLFVRSAVSIFGADVNIYTSFWYSTELLAASAIGLIFGFWLASTSALLKKIFLFTYFVNTIFSVGIMTFVFTVKLNAASCIAC